MKITIAALVLGLVCAPYALSASCSLSKDSGFHISGNNLCLNDVDYVDGIAKLRQLDINSFSVINKEMVVFSATSPLGSFLMLGTPKGNIKILGDMPNSDLKKSITGIRSVSFSQKNNEIYFISNAWAVSGAIHKLSWNHIINVLDNIPVEVDDIEFITSGNTFYVIQQGKYQGYLIANKHKYKKGGGSYDVYSLVSPSGKEIREIDEYQEKVNEFLYTSGTNETIK